MKCIEIIAVPKGAPPEQVRRAWIGLRLPFDPYLQNDSPADGYVVEAVDAVEILRLHNAEAARWWEENTEVMQPDARIKKFIFDASSCRITDDIPSIIAEPGHGGISTTVKQFLSLLNTRSRQQRFWPFIADDDLQLALKLSPGEWSKFEKSALTRPIVLLFSSLIADDCSFYIAGVTTETRFKHAHEEGHGLLRILHELAVEHGVAVALDEIDRPLSYVDIGLRQGIIEEAEGGGIKLTQKGKSIVVKPSDDLNL